MDLDGGLADLRDVGSVAEMTSVRKALGPRRALPRGSS